MKGIDIITDEKGNNKAILLDLLQFKKDNIKAEEVIAALANLKELIESAAEHKTKDNTWDTAKEKLKALKSST